MLTLSRKIPDICNAAILLSAWSAAASDIYIASRFLFFLARRGHAPGFLAFLFRSRHSPNVPPEQDNDTDTDSEQDSDTESDQG